ncbi:hypothetical protein T265_12836, partial [Opisthorchis viverrini]
MINNQPVCRCKSITDLCSDVKVRTPDNGEQNVDSVVLALRHSELTAEQVRACSPDGCPPTHSGPRCLQENLPEPSSAVPMILVTPSQDATTGEEDFILDQSHIGANIRMKSAPEGTDKCHLPEFQHSSGKFCASLE